MAKKKSKKSKRVWLHIASVSLLTAPNLVYLGCNFNVLKEANAVALTMTAIIIFAIIGVGALAHFKANLGVWVTIIGVMVLALSNIAQVVGVGLIIEGCGLALDSYVLKPFIKKAKIEELKENGETVTYTSEIK